jgi:hypothetical protein
MSLFAMQTWFGSFAHSSDGMIDLLGYESRSRMERDFLT